MRAAVTVPSEQEETQRRGGWMGKSNETENTRAAKKKGIDEDDLVKDIRMAGNKTATKDGRRYSIT